MTRPRHDLPRRQQGDGEDEVGDALPAAVVRQLLAPGALAQLPNHAAARRVQIALEVGRRPGEVVGLPLDCLDYDETVDITTGATTQLPVLVHPMPKVKKVGYRLPITQRTADLIVEQQTVRGRSTRPPRHTGWRCGRGGPIATGPPDRASGWRPNRSAGPCACTTTGTAAVG